MSDSLVAAARQAQQQAYAPYSHYQVGAAVETADGTVYTGCNIENASYGLAICAERVALGAAMTAGARQFRRIAVVSSSEPPASPCGACRQVLAELAPDAEVIAAGPRSVMRWTVAELLPVAFTPGHLT
ncbi:MAG: cytidine deaminase [Gemmatimonadota bacterium]